LGVEGTVRLGALAKLPKDVVPQKLSADGDVPFTVRLSQGSPLAVGVTADASGASIAFGELVNKAAGRRAKLAAKMTMTPDGKIDIPSVRADLAGGGAEFAGALSPDLATLTVRRLDLRASDLPKLAELSPRLTARGASGSASINLSGTVPIKEVKAGTLTGIDLTGAATLDKLQVVPAAMPDLQVTANGKATLTMDAVDAGGLTVAALNTKSGKGGTLNLRTLKVTPVKDGVPLFKAIDALRLTFDVRADEIDAGALLAAMPKDKKEPKDKKPLDLSFLKNHVADGTISVVRLTHPKFGAQDVSAKLKLDDNKLTTPTPATASVYQGNVEAEMTADLSKEVPGDRGADADRVKHVIAHQGTVRLNQVDMNTAASAAANLTGVLRGKVGGTFNWSGVGFSKDQILSEWSGNGDLLVQNGAVVDLQGHPLAAKIFGPVATHLGAKAFPNNRYEYGRLKTDFRFENGKIGLRDTRLSGANDLDFVIKRALVSLDKTIDAELGVQAPMDLSMELIREKVTTNETALKVIRSRLQKNQPTLISFRVSGSPGAPRVVPELTIVPWATRILKDTVTDPGNLLQDVLQRGARDVIERELEKDKKDRDEDTANGDGKENNNADGEKQEEEQDEDDRRRDAVRDLLKGLLD
ncbi:MAG: hypothetical protein ACOC8E_08265, partial [Planctomycetota bacterium]